MWSTASLFRVANIEYNLWYLKFFVLGRIFLPSGSVLRVLEELKGDLEFLVLNYELCLVVDINIDILRPKKY